jgi:undecaprenyl diphosphate synthase
MSIRSYPKHIWFIADWNRTWARNQWLPHLEWHRIGFHNTIDFIKYIYEETPISITTVWALSTENLKNRDSNELDYLFQIYKLISEDMYAFLETHQIDFNWMGRPEWLPDDLIAFLLDTQDKYTYWKWKVFNLAVNYGGQDEIVRWVKKYIDDWNDIHKMNTKSLSSCMDFAWQDPVDLIIRTKWDLSPRLSWFMSWWAGYAQLYFCPKMCPEFSIEDLNEALEWFDSISDDRNYWK